MIDLSLFTCGEFIWKYFSDKSSFSRMGNWPDRLELRGAAVHWSSVSILGTCNTNEELPSRC